MFYLKAFVNSLYNISWLSDQRNSGRKAANYIALFILVLSVAFGGYLTTFIPHELRTLRDDFLANVPDFRAVVENGKLTVYDLEQPFIKTIDDGEDTFTIYIDTTSSTTVDINNIVESMDYDAIILTHTQFAIYEASSSYETASGKTTIQNVSEFPNGEFTKSYLISWSDKFLASRELFFAIITLASFVILAIGKLVYLLGISFIVWIVARIAKQTDWSYRKVYTMGLFALTAPSVLVALLSAFKTGVPYLYTVALTGLMIAVVLHRSTAPAMSEVAPTDSKK